MAEKFLGQNGLNKLITLIKNALGTKVDKVEGKGLSTNDYTTSEKTKLGGIATGAQVNVLEGIQKNGTAVTIKNKVANITVPTKTSEITNDSGFITISDVPEGAAASTTTPKMDGTAAVGKELAFARGDHVHPSDTTKVDKVTGKGLSTNDYTTAEKNKLTGIAEGAQVNVIESIKVNNSTVTPTNKAVNITVPTKISQITNDSGFITADDVVEPSSTSPKVDGTAAVGTEDKYARGDHVHPTDTSRAAASDLTSHTGNTTVHITAAERTTWNAKQNALTAGTDYLTPAQVNSAIDSKISSVYTPKGSIAFASLPTAAEGLVGDVYNITDAFTTTAAFVEGAGKSYPAGTNVVCVKEGSAYKWDVLAGFIDITEITATEVQTIWDSVFNPAS